MAQAALSVVLLVGAGLFVRSLGRVHDIDLGIEPDRIVVVQVRYPTSIDAPGERARRTQVLKDAMLRALSARRRAVEPNGGLPFQSSVGLYVRVAGWDSIPPLAGGGASVRAVTDGYFNTVGTRVLEGRAFTPPGPRRERAGYHRQSGDGCDAVAWKVAIG